MPTPELAAAFRATTYRVITRSEVFDLRLDEANPAFANWLLQQGFSRWAIVTACNPGGVLALAENAARNAALQEKIAANGWRHVPACNRADAGDWPDEDGFCVLGVAPEILGTLAAEFGQSAIVCGADDGWGKLVWLGAQ